MTAGPGDERLHGPGRWLVTTETFTHVLELDEAGTGSLVRHAGEGDGPAPEATESPPPISVNLRRDAEHIPVMWAGLGRATLCRDPTIRAVVEEHRHRTATGGALAALTDEIATLRAALEALATRVRRHEEQLRRLQPRKR